MKIDRRTARFIAVSTLVSVGACLLAAILCTIIRHA